MAAIYCITNDVNNKQYVGKTLFTIEKRFNEHINDSKRDRCESRPLYSAMRKYGIEHFSIKLLEEVKEFNLLSEREIYWIQKLDTYHNGYNATKGGDGTVLYDYLYIKELITKGYTSYDISNHVGCCKDIVYKVAKLYNVKLRKKDSKIIRQYDLNGKFLNQFFGAIDAQTWLINNKITTSLRCNAVVSRCCIGKLKSAYNYIWEYYELDKL